MQTMYKKILQLPLFQGLSKESITKIIGKVKLHFKTIPANTVFIKQGESCNQLIFMLNGSFKKDIQSPNKIFNIEQEITSSKVIEPDALFGLETNYQASYTTLTSCDLLTIDKNYVLSQLMEYPIFKLNFLNILSGRIHSYSHIIWHQSNSNTILDRFKRFISLHTDHTEHAITLHIKMEDLAFLLNDTRLNVSRMLNSLKSQKSLSLKRKMIHIPNFSRL